jgi:glycyl-tRNA synthetase
MLIIQLLYLCRIILEAMNEQDFGIKEIISHAKEYGFVYPSSEIYDGLQAVYDYGPYGVELKKNLKELWCRPW